MNKDYTVLVEYRNRDMEKVGERSFYFQEYADLIALEIKRIILDVEDMVYRVEEQHPKANWSSENMVDFQKIRHKLLDEANSVARLPQQLRYKGKPCDSKQLNEFIADVINDRAN